ncbi:MAG: hypothetical protein C0601_05195 [Candidatus Muiribacterium halophilum]|uniref:Uncharacterized protein n=1 Tax=Muiribacterium halophilum TaxID=2053465 RepID=A0A2N5ZID8_MUIH1|nr:MAG: hypothetical protein C0601_05195 [Candidatus Muirbacterium halophilum]
MKKILILSLILITVSVFTFAEEALSPKQNEIQLKLHSLAYDYWEFQTDIARYNYSIDDSSLPEYEIKTENMHQETSEFVDYVLYFYENNDREAIEYFFNEYEKLDDVSKRFIYNEVISQLKEYEAASGKNTTNSIEVATTRAGEYLPGYGYTDPDYLYKLGRELRSEHVQDFWKKEARTFESSSKHKIYVKASVAAEWANSGSAGGNIEGFEITGSTNYNVNGEVENYVEVEITLKETVETFAVIMYEKRKVFFEVYKAKLGFFLWISNGFDFVWDLDGECFLYKEFPAATDEIIEAEDLMNMNM